MLPGPSELEFLEPDRTVLVLPRHDLMPLFLSRSHSVELGLVLLPVGGRLGFGLPFVSVATGGHSLGGSVMSIRSVLTLVGFVSLLVLSPARHASLAAVAKAGVGPKLQSSGPITFGPGDVLFVADNQAATIYALEIGSLVSGNAPGTKNVAGVDQQIAALVGTDAREVQIADLAISPTSRNAFLSLSRGRGANAKPILVRIDGAGSIDVISLADVRYTMVALPNPPEANPSSSGDRPVQRRDGSWIANDRVRMQTVTDMAYVDGRLFIAGLSNDEFSSKLRSIAYPFAEVDQGTSVEIWHAAHGQFETQSPVYTFVPYEVDGEQNLIAGYLCTPLVTFPVSDLKPGAKVMGRTIAELGNRNRPLDMIVYSKAGRDYLLMSNTSRGVMKIPTEGFGDVPGLAEPVPDGNKAGVAYETIAHMTGVEQLDLLDDQHAIVIARDDSGAANLKAVVLP